MKAIIAINKTSIPSETKKYFCGVSFVKVTSVPTSVGNLAMIPAKRIIEIPLPIPLLSTLLPSQTTIEVPAMSESIITNAANTP